MYKYILIFMVLTIIIYSNTFSQFAAEKRWTTGQGVNGTASKHWIGDFNGDGLADKLQLAGDNHWYVALSKVNCFDGEVDWTTTPDPNATGYLIGDFNGDGMDDILSFNNSYDALKVSLSFQDFSYTDPKYFFKAPVQWGLYSSLFSHFFVGDYDGDGKSDVLLQNQNGNLSIYRSTGSGFNWYNSSFSCNYPTYVGDFDGDGYTDLAYYKQFNGTTEVNEWWVALNIYKNTNSFTYMFMPFTKWTSGQGRGSSGHFICDLNGDRKADKLNYNASTGNWYAALSAGDHFGAEYIWCTGQGIGARGVYVGDFDGDHLCDRLTYISNGEWWVGLNIYPRPTPYNKKIVASWFTNWYNTTDTASTDNFWNYKKRDFRKTPVAEWTTVAPTSGNIYDSYTTATINAQIDAMVKAKINLIIVDNTNGWNTNSTVRRSTAALFSVLDSRRLSGKQDSIKVVISLGYEFWGEKTCIGNKYPYPGWATQLKNQRSALDSIKKKYVDPYPYIYMNYLNRPLVIAYISDDGDYPLPTLWHYNDFTVISAVNWAYTHGYKNGTKFYNGMDSKKYWGWGGWIQTQNNPLPFNKEEMSIMPGTQIYWTTGGTNIPRDIVSKGDYYINSWKRVLEVDPNIVTIADWNNWNEETAIEGCLDADGVSPLSGWTDYNGHQQFDWYLQITRAYAKLYKEHTLEKDTYYKIDGEQVIHYWDGRTDNLKAVDFKPSGKPIIQIPSGYNFTKLSKINTEEKLINPSSDYCIEQNYPNPFNPTTTINYSLPKDSRIVLEIYNILGEKITTLVNDNKTAGTYNVNFNGSNLASGIYICRFNAVSLENGERFEKNSKMMLMK